MSALNSHCGIPCSRSFPRACHGVRRRMTRREGEGHCVWMSLWCENRRISHNRLQNVRGRSADPASPNRLTFLPLGDGTFLVRYCAVPTAQKRRVPDLEACPTGDSFFWKPKDPQPLTSQASGGRADSQQREKAIHWSAPVGRSANMRARCAHVTQEDANFPLRFPPTRRRTRRSWPRRFARRRGHRVPRAVSAPSDRPPLPAQPYFAECA